jgi:hypothetical protein
MGSTLEALMKKRADERLAAVERKWDGGKGSLVPDFDPRAAALLPAAAKASRATEELLLAATTGDAAAAYAALEKGGDPSFVFGEAYGCRPGTGYTALMAAAHRGHIGEGFFPWGGGRGAWIFLSALRRSLAFSPPPTKKRTRRKTNKKTRTRQGDAARGRRPQQARALGRPAHLLGHRRRGRDAPALRAVRGGPG